jgi:ribonucleoside-diphosphate reductase beta chain
MPQSTSFWLHTKIVMAKDMKDFNENLSEHEKNMVSKILLGFTQTEILVGDYWTGVVAKVFPKHEIVMMALCFGYFETIHQNAYDLTNENLGINRDLEAFLGDKTLQDKLENVVGFEYDPTKGELDYRKLALSLASFSGVVEGVVLFSSFAVLMSFMPRDLLIGLSEIIEYSVRDENLHSNMGINLFNQMCAEIPELLNDELEEEIYKAFRTGYDIESVFIDEVFALGELPNLNKPMLLNFMKYRCNDRLMAMKLKPIYTIDNQLLLDMDWFDMAINTNKKTDFFAHNVSSYQKSTQDWGTEGLSLD